MLSRITVVKVGGNEIDDARWLERLARAVAARTTRGYNRLPWVALVDTTSARWRTASPMAKDLKMPALLPEW